MKYQKLPIERELEAILDDPTRGKTEMALLRGAAFLETARTRGFQLVTALLRDVEAVAFYCLRTGTRAPERMLGRIECIEELRRGLTAMLPDDQRANVHWSNEATEDFVILDETPVADGVEGDEE